MDIQIINPTQYFGWDDLILSKPDYSIFHSSAWAEVLQDSYGYRPNYFTIIEKDKLSALVPIMEVKSLLTGTRGVSLPFTDFCEPILDNGVKFGEVFDEIAQHGRKCGWKFVEFRGGQGILQEAPSSETFLSHMLDLSRGEEKVLSGLRDSTRRGTKKATAEGVEVTINNSVGGMEVFFRLNSLTRKRHGLPPQPFNFFKHLYDRIISRNLGFVITALFKGEPIAGAIFLTFGEKAVYKYGASDLEYQNLRANNLVMWEAIRRCCQQGFKSLSFGRTEPENTGLIQFKSGWGTTEKPISYYRYDLKMESFVGARSNGMEIYNKIFRSMPLPILNRLGALFYRHAG